MYKKKKSVKGRRKKKGLLMPYKDYSPKQKKLAAVAPPFNKITAADLKKLRDSKRRPKIT